MDEPEEKLKIIKMAWETKGARSVQSVVTIKGKTNFKNTAKDVLITSPNDFKGALDFFSSLNLD